MKKASQIVVTHVVTGASEVYPGLKHVAHDMFKNNLVQAEESSILSWITRACRDQKPAYGFHIIRVPNELPVPDQQMFIRRHIAAAKTKNYLAGLADSCMSEAQISQLESLAEQLKTLTRQVVGGD